MHASLKESARHSCTHCCCHGYSPRDACSENIYFIYCTLYKGTKARETHSDLILDNHTTFPPLKSFEQNSFFFLLFSFFFNNLSWFVETLKKKKQRCAQSAASSATTGPFIRGREKVLGLVCPTWETAALISGSGWPNPASFPPSTPTPTTHPRVNLGPKREEGAERHQRKEALEHLTTLTGRGRIKRIWFKVGFFFLVFPNTDVIFGVCGKGEYCVFGVNNKHRQC